MTDPARDGGQALWDAAIAAAKLIQEEMRRRREERKAAARERRRERYARDKASGKIGRRKAERARKKAEAAALERSAQGGPGHTSCYCAHTPMPPCSWCENGGGEEAEG